MPELHGGGADACSTAPRVAAGGAPSPCTADCRGTPPAPPTLDVTDEADWCRRVSDRDEAIDREASRPGPAEPAMDRDSAPAENRRPPWTDMELAGREEGAPLRGVDEPASAGGCCCEAESPRGHSPTIVPSSRSSSPATTSQPLSAPPPTSCRGRPRFPSRRDCAWTRCAASASPSVKTPPCVPSDSAGRLHQCEPSLKSDVRSFATAAGCSGGTTRVHEFTASLWTTWKASATSPFSSAREIASASIRACANA